MKTGYIDLYCERTGAEYWAEPLNAMTNIAFILSGVAITVLILRGNAKGRVGVIWILNGLIYTIGVGSWLFHTHAVLWAMLIDIIPIGGFILLYTWSVFRGIVGAGLPISFLGLGVVLTIAALIHGLSGYEGGAYIAALFALISVGTYLHYWRPNSAGPALLCGGALFAISLAIRTLDQPLCGQITIGTHFVWHILNATVLFIIVHALIKHGRLSN
ncbi:MAG: ceramidase domain-containing protein [Pseudomonadota bacterium]|nr:ceramidase domain-containing protein [Pseudomonadota bacterium]